MSALHTKPKHFHGLDLTFSWFVHFYLFIFLHQNQGNQSFSIAGCGRKKKKKPRNNERITGNYILLLYCEVTQLKRFSDLQETSLHFLSFFILNKHKETRHYRNPMIYCSSDGVKCIYSSTVTTARTWGLAQCPLEHAGTGSNTANVRVNHHHHHRSVQCHYSIMGRVASKKLQVIPSKRA